MPGAGPGAAHPLCRESLPRISPMLVHPATRLAATSACLFISSAAAATIGVRQKLRRGVWWWIGANLGLAAALMLHAMGDDSPWYAPLASVCALQWPIVTLTGMRRFFSRGGSALPPWADWLALGLACLLAAGAAITSLGWVGPAQVLAVAMLAVTLYVALAIARLEDFETTPILKSLLVCLVCSAGLQAVTSCGSCAKGQPWPTGHHAGGACCSGKTEILFDEHELAALVHAGTRVADLTPPREDHAGCAFRGSHGCTLETAHRPARCVHYVCDLLRRELHDRGQLAALEADLAQLDRLMQQFTAVHQARLDRETVAPLLDALARVQSRR